MSQPDFVSSRVVIWLQPKVCQHHQSVVIISIIVIIVPWSSSAVDDYRSRNREISTLICQSIQSAAVVRIYHVYEMNRYSFVAEESDASVTRMLACAAQRRARVSVYVHNACVSINMLLLFTDVEWVTESILPDYFCNGLGRRFKVAFCAGWPPARKSREFDSIRKNLGKICSVREI